MYSNKLRNFLMKRQKKCKQLISTCCVILLKSVWSIFVYYLNYICMNFVTNILVSAKFNRQKIILTIEMYNVHELKE